MIFDEPMTTPDEGEEESTDEGMGGDDSADGEESTEGGDEM